MKNNKKTVKLFEDFERRNRLNESTNILDIEYPDGYDHDAYDDYKDSYSHLLKEVEKMDKEFRGNYVIRYTDKKGQIWYEIEDLYGDGAERCYRTLTDVFTTIQDSYDDYGVDDDRIIMRIDLSDDRKCWTITGDSWEDVIDIYNFPDDFSSIMNDILDGYHRSDMEGYKSAYDTWDSYDTDEEWKNDNYTKEQIKKYCKFIYALASSFEKNGYNTMMGDDIIEFFLTNYHNYLDDMPSKK